MSKADARRLQAFQRQTAAYEKLLLRTVRQFIKTRGGELARLALVSDWDNFRNLTLELQGEFKKRLRYILTEFGNQTLSELK